MVVGFTKRTHGENQEFLFVEGIWLHRKSHQIRFFLEKRPYLHHTCATWNEQPSNIKSMTMVLLYKMVNQNISRTDAGIYIFFITKNQFLIDLLPIKCQKQIKKNGINKRNISNQLYDLTENSPKIPNTSLSPS